MIDIFYSNGPYYIGGTGFYELLLGGLREIGHFLITLILFSGIVILAKRLRRKQILLAVSILMPVLQIIYVWSVSIHSEFFFSFIFAFILTVQLKILNLIPLQKEDYLLLFSVLLFPARLFNSTSALIGHLWLFWVIFAACYVISKIGIGKLHGNHFVCYFVYIVLSLSAYTIYIFLSFLTPGLAKKFESYASGLVCTLFIVMIIFILAALFIRVQFRQRLLRLNQFSQKYRNIEQYFFWFSILVLALCTLIFLPFTIMSSQNTLVLLLFPSLCITLLCVQMAFVFLLFHVAFYKDNATLSQWEKEGLASYYQDLTTNLTTMQEIRHDIKNIFFTMGGFVDRSNDSEMKDFFWNKIYPYSESTIRQSEFFSSIYQLPNETLRAFFYLKLSQMLQHKIPASIRLNILPEYFHLGMDIIDLTRILGILLDNTMDEASKVPNSIVEIQINGNETACSYTIKNSITEDTKLKGIHAGDSTKGAGRGNGLLIVKKIIEQYNNVIINSCIQDYEFIQSLNICMVSEKHF